MTRQSEIIDLHPATPLQLGMLYHAMSQPGSAVFLQHYAMYVDGPFQPQLYVRAWQMVADRHPALRSSFHWQGLDRCFQAVHDHIPIPVRHENLTSLPNDERDARLHDLVRQDRHVPFDTEQPPLIRIMVGTLGPERHAVVVGLHHVVADGWSLGIAMDEVARFYAGLAAGSVPDLPPAPPFRRYADWLAGVDMAAARRFWETRLEASTPCRLPYRQMPQDADSPDALQYHDLPLTAEETATLLTQARAAGITVATIMQAAWALLLARFERQDRVLFAMSNANRPAPVPEIDRIFGPLMAVLPCNLELDGDQPVGKWLRDLQRGQVAAREHDCLSPTEYQRLAGFSPLDEFMNSMLILEDMPTADEGAWAAMGLRFRELATYDRTTYPLNMFVYPGDELLLRLGVDARQFPADGARRILQFMRHLCLELPRDTARPLAALTLPGDADHACLSGPPATARAGLWQRLTDGLAAPGMALLDDAGRVLADGAALADSAARIDAQLDAAGVAPGQMVALWQDPGVDYTASVLAAIRRGSAYALVDPQLPAGAVPARLRACGIDTLVTDPDRAAMLEGALRIVVPDDQPRPVPAPRPATDPMAAAAIVWTSGSTGAPKAPVIPQAAILNRLDWGRDALPPEEAPRMILKTSPAFVDSIAELLQPLADGHVAILPDPDAARAPEGLLAAMHRARPTRLVVTPSFLRAMIAADDGGAVWPLRRLHISGEALPGDLLGLLRGRLHDDCAVLNIYGSAEVTADVTAWQVRDLDHHGAAPIGQPLPGCSIWLLDQTGQPVPQGGVGEIHAEGVCLAQGYLGAGDQGRFRDWTHAGETRRVYATGDLARRDGHGDLVHMGRADAQIKIRGIRIEPAEIEARLTELPQVRQAVVTAWPAPGGLRLVAYVQPAAHDTQTTDRVSEWQSLYDNNYAGMDQALDDFRIWQSAITGQPIPADEMRSWVAQTIALARDVPAGHPDDSLVEIGCGQGLLLGRMAQGFAAYLGTDISEQALDRVRDLQARDPGLAHVGLAALAADAPLPPDLIPQRGFATALLSSVVQYFPDGDYLLRSLQALIPAVAKGGRIILSDLRGLHVQNLLNAEILLSRGADDMAAADLLRRLQDMANHEPELLVDPRLFATLGTALPRLTGCEIRPKPGPEDNELTRYRYDAVLYLDHAPAQPAAPVAQWQDADDLTARLGVGDAFTLAGIPQRGLHRAQSALALLEQGDLRDVADLRDRLGAAQGMTPADLRDMAARHGMETSIALDPDDPARLVAHFHRGGGHTPAWPTTGPGNLAAWANRPHSAAATRKLAELADAHLRRHLAPGQVPDQILVVQDWPRSASQKILKHRLPRPALPQEQDGRAAPQTPTEIALADLWRRILNRRHISRETGFFEAGGNSLTLTQLAFSVGKSFGIRFPLTAAFAAPVLEQMAARIDAILTGTEAEPVDDRERLLADAKLADAIARPQPWNGRMWPEGAAVVLHTGAGGALSHWMLRHLLAQPGLTVVTLGGSAPDQARHALAQAWNGLGFGRLDLLDRLEILPGSLERPGFGLTADAWQDLANRIGVIVHAGIHIDMAAPYARLRMANVLGTREVLRLSAQAEAPVHALGSFATISHRDASTAARVIDERADLPDGAGLENDYRKSRWVSETMLTRAAARGLPVALHRMPLLCGTSTGDVPDPDEILWRVVRAMVTLGAVPPGGRPLDMMAMDHAVDTMLALARAPDAGPGVRHILGAQGLTWDDVGAALRDCGYDLRAVSGREWEELLRDHVACNPQDATLAGLLALVHDEGADHAAFHPICGAATRSQLDAPPPATDRAQIAVCIATLRGRGLLPHPALEEIA